ncbi:MAG TPA: MFS transporter, partial [Burkholderiaceae bacterium]|nr:MFS transporter [Burkholderiaceae bacterium]
IALRELDPRVPFALSSIALAAATLGILWVERHLARAPAAPVATQATVAKPMGPVFWFLVAVVLLALGSQIHVALNSGPLYLRYVKPTELVYLTPVFWIGFNLLMLPASFATRRYGGLVVMGVGGAVAAIASLLAFKAGNLNMLVAMQFIAGGAWGCVLMSAIAAALAIGHTGREGKLTGGLFSLLALAALARMAIVATEMNKDPQFLAYLSWAPAAAWAAAGVLLLLLIPAQRKLLGT